MRLRDLPIRRKLMAGALLVSGAALSVALLACFGLQMYLARQSAERDLSALAVVVADNAAGPLAFNDSSAAKDLLSALRYRPEIAGARILDASGKTLGTYSPPGRTHDFTAPPPGENFRSHGFSFCIRVPVVHNGEPLGTLELCSNVRDALLKFAAIAAGAFVLVLVAALGLVALLTSRFQRSLTAPVERLAHTARRVAQTQDYTLRTTREGDDEIGALTDAFNHMLSDIHERDVALKNAKTELSAQVRALQHEITERRRTEAELERTHQDLVEASRRAGQADVATSVLHNVGNVLNSVGVSANLAAELLRNTRIGNVARAGSLLVEHRESLGPFFVEHPKGKLFLDYLPQLGTSLEDERNAILAELDLLGRNIEHIKEIVAMQQSYARAGGIRELLKPVDVVEHALALNAESLARHNIRLERQYQDVPAFALDKHRVLQVLVNLVTNAKNALDAATSLNDRRITVSVAERNRHVRVSVVDNGVGISAENLTRIFQHGFTTRREGHGFGLHSGAIAARQMGGTLRVESPGLGLGATFTLELPMDPPAADASLES